jgi:GNAT superfamily N-acetyltransferase
MSLPNPRLFNSISDHHLLPQLAQIQADCITHDKQLATFLPPLSHVRMLDYWREISSDVEKGRTVVVLQFADENESEVAGYVCLMMPVTETGPFRGEVNTLMVNPRHRRKGVARRVMGLLEDVARERGRHLLVSSDRI